jgi:predicted Zn-dependent protease
VVFDVLRGISFAFTISFPVVTDSAGMFLNWLNDVVAERAYSRKIEEEADSVGLEIMARAGYDPRAMLDLWELMAAVEADAEAMGYGGSLESRFQLLRTHPTSEARQEAIASQLPKAMRLWQEARAPQRATIERILAEKSERVEQRELAPDEVRIGAVVAKIQPRVEFAVAPELPEPEPEPEPEREV